MARRVRLATSPDRGDVARTLARAFADDPVMGWIYPDPDDRARRLPRLFALLFDTDGSAGMRLTTAEASAATLWRAPGRARTGPLTMLRHAWPMWRALGPNLARALAVSNAIEAHLPSGDFWYLHIAGCDPAARGRGLGRAAIEAGIARVAGRLPVYLENSNAANLGFYRALGFTVDSEWRVGADGPRLWSMTRLADLAVESSPA